MRICGLFSPIFRCAGGIGRMGCYPDGRARTSYPEVRQIQKKTGKLKTTKSRPVFISPLLASVLSAMVEGQVSPEASSPVGGI